MPAFVPSTMSSFTPLHSFFPTCRIPSSSHSFKVPRAHATRRSMWRHVTFHSPLLPPEHPARAASRLVRVAARGSAHGLRGVRFGACVRDLGQRGTRGDGAAAQTEPAFAAIVVLIEGFEDLVPSAIDATYDDTEKLRLLLKLAQCIIMLSPY
eukprot:CAMPEP_0174896296 /NCGR_PEP_ID=MMETSP0167-20121228/10496_1 /TAXON_ID=38298 /ORGANISM="Rhodella maculata, Strain CCMP736" /LENGTH=152 /DNA_ID=CAMNT_0016135813 /DNA_START=320 /DNA_END=779 /DNA_ORIENTATION=+